MSEPNGDPAPPAIVKKPWDRGFGPYYIGLFLWVVFLDQLGRRALPVGGLGWSLAGLAIGGPLAYLLLFRGPALLGFRTGEPIVGLSGGAFGRGGARVVPGLLIGLAQVVWFAVAVTFATDLTLRGLIGVRFFDERSIRPITLGPVAVRGPLYLTTALAWTVMIGLIGRYFVRLVSAIMYVFPIFPALILGGVMMAELGGVRWFGPTGIDPDTLARVPEGREAVWSMMLVVQMVLGFFAMAGLHGVDWGAASLAESDIRKGGWIAVGLAPVVIGTLALIAVAGHLGRVEEAKGLDAEQGPFATRGRGLASNLPAASTGQIRPIGEPRPVEARFATVLADGFGAKVGATMLIVFGCMSLAPAVFAMNVAAHRLHEAVPRLSRTRWTYVAMVLSYPLTASGRLERLEPVVTVMGALFAPVVACLVAEASRRGGAASGPRRGLNPPGLIGWVFGLVVGLLPLIGGRLEAFRPATFWAFLVAFATYRVVAATGGESPPIDRVAAESD